MARPASSPARGWLTTGPRLLAAVLLVGLALGGCDQVVSVPTRFPEPLVDRLPLRVGVHYPPAFRDYVYREDGGNGQQWSIKAGDANVALFDRVFGRLFTDAVRLEALPGPGAASGFDAYVEPAVDAFEFATPAQSGTDEYSVWIRYTLNVYGPDGNLITAWKVSAYGQSGSAVLRAARSMEAATILAMRDAGATISVGFARQKAIRKALLREAPKAVEENSDDPS